MSRMVVLALALAVLGTAASGRVLLQGAEMTSDAANTTQPATPTATYTSFNEALQAANTTGNLTTLIAAVEAAGGCSLQLLLRTVCLGATLLLTVTVTIGPNSIKLSTCFQGVESFSKLHVCVRQQLA